MLLKAIVVAMPPLKSEVTLAGGNAGTVFALAKRRMGGLSENQS